MISKEGRARQAAREEISRTRKAASGGSVRTLTKRKSGVMVNTRLVLVVTRTEFFY